MGTGCCVRSWTPGAERRRRHRPEGGDGVAAQDLLQPAWPIDEVLEGLAEVQLGEDGPEGRVTEVEREVRDAVISEIDGVVAFPFYRLQLGQVLVRQLGHRQRVRPPDLISLRAAWSEVKGTSTNLDSVGFGEPP